MSLRNLSLLRSIFSVLLRRSCFCTETHIHTHTQIGVLSLGWLHTLNMSVNISVPSSESPHFTIKLCFSPDRSVLKVNGYPGTEIKVQFELNSFFLRVQFSVMTKLRHPNIMESPLFGA